MQDLKNKFLLLLMELDNGKPMGKKNPNIT